MNPLSLEGEKGCMKLPSCIRGRMCFVSGSKSFFPVCGASEHTLRSRIVSQRGSKLCDGEVGSLILKCYRSRAPHRLAVREIAKAKQFLQARTLQVATAACRRIVGASQHGGIGSLDVEVARPQGIEAGKDRVRWIAAHGSLVVVGQRPDRQSTSLLDRKSTL